MSKEQQINQTTYLKHQNRQAYLVYCQQIITYLTVLNWLKTMYMVKESTIYNEKCTSEAEILSTESHQEIDDVKPLKHKEKPNLKTGLASESLYYQKDEDTGLYYANARYYDSETGRFLREDPLSGDVNRPPSLHRYLYANANPNYYTDPTGQFSLCGLAPRCFDGDDILSATQSQLARNDETLVNNLQRAEKYTESNSFGSDESDIIGNASYRLLTEGLQGINNAAQFILDSTILASDSRNLTKAKAQAEVNIRKTEESVRNAVSFVAENKLKAGGILLKSTIEGFSNFRTNLYNASLGDAKAQADVLVTGTKIATAVVPASKFGLGSKIPNEIKFSGVDIDTNSFTRIPIKNSTDWRKLNIEFNQRFDHKFASTKEKNAAWFLYRQSFDTKKELVIGRLENTSDFIGSSTKQRLVINKSNWSVNTNDAWVQGGIDAKKSFYISSEIKFGTVRNIGNKKYPTTIFYRELRQLKDAGYTKVGDYMVPPN